MPSSRGSSQPRDRTHVSCIGRWILYSLRHVGSASSCIAWYIVSAKMCWIYEQYGTAENFSQYEFFFSLANSLAFLSINLIIHPGPNMSINQMTWEGNPLLTMKASSGSYAMKRIQIRMNENQADGINILTTGPWSSEKLNIVSFSFMSSFIFVGVCGDMLA